MAGFPRFVLVTGSSRGLGLEFVKQICQLSDCPDIIFAACRNPEKATELQKISDGSTKTKVHLMKMDVCSDEDIENAVYEVGAMVGDNGLNLIINNAGILERERDKLGALTRECLMRHFNTNAIGPLLISQAFVPLLRKASANHSSLPLSITRAAIINISTGVASLEDNTSGGKLSGYPYRMSKAALNMATRSLGWDLSEDQILCVNILPGYVKTDMTGWKGNLTADQSIGSMLETFRKLGNQHNAGYFNYKGEKFPW